MDQLSQEKLAEIVAKEPASLTDSDIEFLRARRSYLSEEHRAVFKDVLSVEAEAPQESSEESEPPKKAKKAKKAKSEE